MTKFRKHIKALRKEGHSMQAIADMIGIARVTLYRYLEGTQKPRKAAKDSIFEVFEIEV